MSLEGRDALCVKTILLLAGQYDVRRDSRANGPANRATLGIATAMPFSPKYACGHHRPAAPGMPGLRPE